VEILELRIKYPHKTIRELGAMCTPPISKFAYAGRLRRILQGVPRSTRLRDG
jgi:DNA-binding transcriptional regulator WhiA